MLRRSFFVVGSLLGLLCTQACGSTAPADAGDMGAATGGAQASGGSPATGAQPGVSTGGASQGDGGGSSTGGSPSGGQGPGAGGVLNGSGGNENGSGGGPNGDPTAAQLAAAAMGRGVNLGQMFESTQHPRTLAAASAKIDAYYARGFRNVRIPITWTETIGGDLLANPTTGEVNRGNARLAVIESVVDYALSKPDLFIIINAHHEAALKTQSRSAVLERLWQDIADIFGDRNERLLFEILNEPHRDDGTAMPAADLRLMTGLAYDKIRAVNPERIILFGGNQWFAAHEIPEVWTSLDEIGGGNDPYLMATFHHYDPWTFCGDNQGTYDDAWTDENQSGPMNTMLDWAKTVGGGVPVHIGEWGVGWQSVLPSLTCNNIREWYTKFHSVHAGPLGIPTSVWDDGGWFRIFNHGSGNFDNNLIDCIEGSCEWTGTERMNDGCRP